MIVVESPAGWLVQTKLQPPELRSDTAPRSRLIERLHDGLRRCRLTLISAPASYGKTTLLSSIPRALPDLPLAWISLDAEDNDPACFIGGLITVIRGLNPECCETAQAMLGLMENPATELRRAIGLCINEIVQTLHAPFVVVLDDLHVVTEPRIYEALEYLIERMPPQMHLVIATREDPSLPLALLRARRQLALAQSGR